MSGSEGIGLMERIAKLRRDTPRNGDVLGSVCGVGTVAYHREACRRYGKAECRRYVKLPGL